MKTVFDLATRQELVIRVNALQESSLPQWGKMTAWQMVRHCVLWEDMALGKKDYPRVFIGRLFGKMALKSMLKDDKPLARNSPTIPPMKISGTGDLGAEKAKWIGLINEYAQFPEHVLLHPFFGKMTKEQTGWMAYKHIDHHLRQFNC